MSKPQKEEEREHFERFAELQDNFPDGEWDQAESPDLRVHTGQEVLGVEHTRRIYPPDKKGIERIAQEKYRRRTVQRAKEIFEDEYDILLEVDVHFQRVYGLELDPEGLKMTSSRVDEVADRIASLVSKHHPEKPGDERLEYHEYRDEMPKGIRSIQIFKHSNMDRSLWQSPEGGGVARLTPGLLQETIDGKEEDVERYRQACDRVWLLIVTDGRAPSSFFDWEHSQEALERGYESSFDRLFLMSYFQSRLVELNQTNS